MKTSTQTSKSTPSTSYSATNSRSKRNSKDREKRKSVNDTNNHNSNDKGSPTKESSTRLYAGIGAESICTYAEQTTFEHLSEEVCDLLTEDTNYRLRYIIQDAVLKARLSGRNHITCNDIDQTFANLQLERVYGAPNNPKFVPLGDHNLYYLDDTEVNLMDLALQETTYEQPGETYLVQKWLPEQNEISKTMKNYFSTMCLSIVDNDVELRNFALKDIGENPQVGPIIEWFYRFSYFLLQKDITYNCLTLYALDLIDALENSTIGRMNVSEKMLKLLVRLLLQRLLKTVTAGEVLKPMCAVLALLCDRQPLRNIVFTKIKQKMPQICLDCALSMVTIVNCMGIDAVEQIFMPNMNYFLLRIKQTKEPDLTYAILASYNIICESTYLNNANVYNAFNEVFSDFLVIFWRPFRGLPKEADKLEINVINVKKLLMNTRRKIEPLKKRSKVIPIQDMFNIQPAKFRLQKKLENHKWDFCDAKDTHVVIGKTTLLLSVLKNKNHRKKHCFDHTLVSYNL